MATIVEVERNYIKMCRRTYQKLFSEKTIVDEFVDMFRKQLSGEIATADEIADDYEDAWGVVYGRRSYFQCLVRCNNKDIKYYEIKKRTIIIFKSAFDGCDKLEALFIPNSVVNDLTFLTSKFSYSVEIHSEKEYLKPYCGNYWFSRMPCNDDIVTEKIISEGSEDDFGVVYGHNFYCRRLLKCNNKEITDYKIKDSTIFVYKSAFEGCDKLESLFVPYTVQNELSFLSTKLPIREESFAEKGYYLRCNFPKDDFGVAYTTDWKELVKCENFKLKTYVIKDGTTIIRQHSFIVAKALQQITLPDSIIEIGDDVFVNCRWLTDIFIPKGSYDKFKKLLSEKVWKKLKEV